jgi:hypothetical protein
MQAIQNQRLKNAEFKRWDIPSPDPAWIDKDVRQINIPKIRLETAWPQFRGAAGEDV